jgi:hypothetical protein
MREAISAYRQITVTPEFQKAERLYAKARHDEAQALWNAERKIAISIAKNLLGISLPIDKVVNVTGLTRKEVENLNDAN